jgi:hypothetical protein
LGPVPFGPKKEIFSSHPSNGPCNGFFASI